MNPVIKNIPLPNNWDWCKAQDCMDVRDGTHNSPKYISEGFPLVTSKNLIKGKLDFSTCSYISKADHDAISKRSAVDNGDILYAMIGTIGNPVIVEKEFKFSIKNVALLKFREDGVFNKYIYYFLESDLTKRQFESRSRGGTQKFVSLKNIRELMIPLPPLVEQQKIVAILDAADQLRQKDQQLIDLYTTLSQSLFLDMFGDPVTNSMGWERGISIDYSECIVPGRNKPKSFSGGVSWITTNDLNHLAYTSESKRNVGLTSDEIETVRARVIPKDSIILTCVGDLGIISINTLPVVVNQQLHTFQCDQKYIIPVFMMYALAYQQPYMNKMASSTTLPYMNKTVCNKIPMIYPPIELQNQFAQHIEKIEQQKYLAQASLGKSETLFNSLLQRAFKGELTQAN